MRRARTGTQLCSLACMGRGLVGMRGGTRVLGGGGLVGQRVGKEPCHRLLDMQLENWEGGGQSRDRDKGGPCRSAHGVVMLAGGEQGQGHNWCGRRSLCVVY
jgi:hypothetical protein